MKSPAKVKQPNSAFSSSLLSRFLLSCLWRNGFWPASCIIKPFIYTLLTDATSCMVGGIWFVFLNLGKRLNSIARWYMLWKAMLMLESSCTIWLKGTLKPGVRGNSINTMQVYPETEHVRIYCLSSNDNNLTCKLEMQLACPIWLIIFCKQVCASPKMIIANAIHIHNRFCHTLFFWEIIVLSNIAVQIISRGVITFHIMYIVKAQNGGYPFSLHSLWHVSLLLITFS